MNDLAINIACAKAFGFEVMDPVVFNIEGPAVPVRLGLWAGECYIWNPLDPSSPDGDAQAFRLLKKFNLAIARKEDNIRVRFRKGLLSKWYPREQLNRAICEVVVKLTAPK